MQVFSSVATDKAGASFRVAALFFSMLVCASALDAAQSEPDDPLFDLSLEQLLATNVEIASRVTSNRLQQPVSISTINREQISLAGARTLNELLMLHVPGYFLVEDQDDAIAAVRGLAPDNNSKLMLLLDGRSLNADWFWGPPDALLNGTDLSWIERIEIIRGPASVTQGQGALLGVVNIVSHAANEQQQAFALTVGEFGRRGLRWQGTWLNPRSDAAAPGRFQLMLSRGEFEGAPIRNEGLAQQIEQDLSVYQRNHHLKRSDYQNVQATYATEHWRIAAYRFEQIRDLYIWRRDREQVGQRLSGLSIEHRDQLGQGQWRNDLFFHVDDYELRSHGQTRPESARILLPGLVMGGSREQRYGWRSVWTSEESFRWHRLALGMEITQLRSGMSNFRGDNFIVNSQANAIERGEAYLNANNRWAFPKQLNIRSIFAEDFIPFSSHWQAFVAARFDSHPDWGSELSPRLGLLWQLNRHHDFRLGWQRGFRGAVGVNYSGGFAGDGLLREDNFDQVQNNPFFAANGNSNLSPVEPERLSSLELAWRFQINENLHLNTVAFLNSTENVIGVGAYFIADPIQRAAAIAAATQIGSDTIGDWGGVFYFQNNAGKLRHRGLEIELNYQDPHSGMQWRASHSLVRVRDADAGQFGAGNIYLSGSISDPLVRSFPQDVTRLQWQWQPPFALQWTSMLTAVHYPKWYAPNAPRSTARRRVSGNTIVNYGLSWRPATLAGFSVDLQLKNIFNAKELYPTTSVAGEGEGNEGAPALEQRASWLQFNYQY